MNDKQNGQSMMNTNNMTDQNASESIILYQNYLQGRRIYRINHRKIKPSA